ncbi:Two-pore potassium channel 1 [Linum perenne]
MASNDNDATRSLLSDAKDSARNATFQRRRSKQAITHKSDDDPHEEDAKQNGDQLSGNEWLDSLLGVRTLKFKVVLILLSLYLALGTLSFFLVMNQIDGKKTNGVLDALYMCVVTMTTVGYGDLVPNTFLAKLFACVYVFTGMAIGGIVLSKAADYIVERQEIVLVKAFHLHDDKMGAQEIMKEVETHKLQYKLLFSAALMGVLMILGTMVLCFVESMDFIDAFYCVCSTITTLGYGDASFSTFGGRLFAVFWILSSTICLAQLFLYMAEWYTDKRKRLMVELILTRKVTSSDLEAADVDHDNVVSPSEFIVFTLKEMGKINDEDIAMAMERLRKLDVDHSGTLTAADLVSPSKNLT